MRRVRAREVKPAVGAGVWVGFGARRKLRGANDRSLIRMRAVHQHEFWEALKAAGGRDHRPTRRAR